MQRREFLAAGVASVTVAMATGTDGEACEASSPRGSVVLVHGANHGGWCWTPVADLLRSKDYEVFAPTLTGLGSRKHLRSPELTLDTHIQDVVNLVLWQELDNVVLVAHSYGGTVITGACDRMRDRVTGVVFLDANTPGDGQPTIPGLTRELAERVAGGPLTDGYLLPPMDPVALGVDPEDTNTIELLRRRLTEQPLQTLSEPVDLQNGGTDGIPRAFILATPEDRLQEFARIRTQEIKSDPTWQYYELLVGHEAMLTAACETADLLDEIIRGLGAA